MPDRIQPLARALWLLLVLSCPLMAQAETGSAANPADEGSAADTAAQTDKPPAGHTVYRSTDANGKVTFTDAPPTDRPSIPIQIADPNVLPAESVEASPEKKPDDKPAYKSCRLTSPQPDQTYGNEVESLSVDVELQPRLQKGDRVQFYLDGAPWGEPIRGLHKQLFTMERGTHTVEAEVINADKRKLIASEKVTFHIKRTSKLGPRAGDLQKNQGFGSVTAPIASIGANPMATGTTMGASASIGGANSFGQPTPDVPPPDKPASK